MASCCPFAHGDAVRRLRELRERSFTEEAKGMTPPKTYVEGVYAQNTYMSNEILGELSSARREEATISHA